MEPGALIGGKYRVSRRIGEGAMGVVWAAVNELTERDVALKLIARQGLPVEMLRTRLLREARACGRISHRNVVEILDVGQTERGDPFLVMPLLRGETLKARIRRDGRLPPLEAARIIAEVARGLSRAHAAGIVHRDLKPANIFLHQEPDRPEPSIKVLDFGVSKIVDAEEVSTTSLGIALGSPSYMSPEQVRAHRTIDHRTDLWTLGVVMFEAITGERPFLGTAPVRVMAEVIGGTIPQLGEVAPHVDRRIADLVSRCLERDVSRRIASANDLLAVLDPLCEEAAAQSQGAALVRPVPGTETTQDDDPTQQMDAADPSTESDAKTLLFSPAAADAEPVEQPVVPEPPSLRGRISLFVAAGAAAGAAVAVIGAIAISKPAAPARARAAVEIAARPLLRIAAPPDAPPTVPAAPPAISASAPAAPAPASASTAPRATGGAAPRAPDGPARPRPEAPSRKRPQPLDLPSDPG